MWEEGGVRGAKRVNKTDSRLVCPGSCNTWRPVFTAQLAFLVHRGILMPRGGLLHQRRKGVG